MALVPYLGPRDILLGSEDERLMANVRPNFRARLDALQVRQPFSVLAALGIGPQWQRRVLGLQTRTYRNCFGPKVDHPHAKQVQAFDEKAWERHFKFTFVRNPYERTVSMYLFLKGKSEAGREPFSAFVKKLIEGVGPLAGWRYLADTWPVYAIGDRIVVDFVGRYETLGADFKSVCDHLNLPHQALGHMKAAPRYDFREFYDTDTRKSVHRLCEREIDYFGYRFEN